MTVELNVTRPELLEVRASGKLTRTDYEYMTPRVEELIRERGKLNVLFEMHEFHGWEVGALWEDVKFDLKHFNDVRRLAMVGNQKWQSGMSRFCKPFTTAKIRYFERGHEEEARAWLDAA